MSGIDRITAERKRQIDVKGFDDSHDEGHFNRELASIAGEIVEHCAHANHNNDLEYDAWGILKKHKGDPVKLLTIAGALIAAEIDRLECVEEDEGIHPDSQFGVGA